MSDDDAVEKLDPTTERIRSELAVMREVVDILEPFSPEVRGRILAGAAARLGHYDIAIGALRLAADARQAEERR